METDCEPCANDRGMQIVAWAAKEGYIRLAHKHKFQITGKGEIFVHFDCKFCPAQRNVPRVVFAETMLRPGPHARHLVEYWFTNDPPA